jgi:formate hydrogenlyase subunit 4
MRLAFALTHVLLALAGSPLLLGLINRVKSAFAGRRGPPLLQLYRDLWKLLHKGAVYSRTTTWVFRAGPVVGLAACLVALLVVPLGGVGGLAAFSGDMVLFVYLLGLLRFLTVLGALDTGSAFEGMGASREVQFAAVTEPAVILGLAALAALTRSLSLSGMYAGLWLSGQPMTGAPAVFLIAAAWFLVLLVENARIPFDDPNTHLELTMIHEVMVLDHGGVDFALIQYGAAVKLWVFSALLAGLLVPVRTGWLALDLAAGLGGVVVVVAAVGVVESTMARLRLVSVPRLLLTASVLSLLGLILALR